MKAGSHHLGSGHQEMSDLSDHLVSVKQLSTIHWKKTAQEIGSPDTQSHVNGKNKGMELYIGVSFPCCLCMCLIIYLKTTTWYEVKQSLMLWDTVWQPVLKSNWAESPGACILHTINLASSTVQQYHVISFRAHRSHAGKSFSFALCLLFTLQHTVVILQYHTFP